jgi:hypothetical protein
LRVQLACGTPAAQPGCGATLRYQFQVSRGNPKEQVFAQMVAAFKTALRDPRLVALNLVQPEDGPTAIADFPCRWRCWIFCTGPIPGSIPPSMPGQQLNYRQPSIPTWRGMTRR